MVLVSVRYLFYQPIDEKIKPWTLRFPAKENPNMSKRSIAIGLISRKFSGMKFFQPSVRLTNQKPFAFVPIRYFRSFVVSVYSHVFISRSYESRFISVPFLLPGLATIWGETRSDNLWIFHKCPALATRSLLSFFILSSTLLRGVEVWKSLTK